MNISGIYLNPNMYKRNNAADAKKKKKDGKNNFDEVLKKEESKIESVRKEQDSNK